MLNVETVFINKVSYLKPCDLKLHFILQVQSYVVQKKSLANVWQIVKIEYRVKQIILIIMYTLALHIDVNKVLYTNHSVHFQKKQLPLSLVSPFT